MISSDPLRAQSPAMGDLPASPAPPAALLPVNQLEQLGVDRRDVHVRIRHADDVVAQPQVRRKLVGLHIVRPARAPPGSLRLVMTTTEPAAGACCRAKAWVARLNLRICPRTWVDMRR